MAPLGPPDRRALATSASLLVVFVGLFLALGALYTVTANTTERLRDARADQRDHHHAVQLSAVNVTEATWNTTDANLLLRVENAGDTTLFVRETDTVVDGTYVGTDEYERVEVGGTSSDLWRPGEVLVLEDEDTVAGFDETPRRAVVVTGTGVAGTSEVREQ